MKPDYLLPLATTSEMAHWDERSIEFGIPEAMLMENAGRAVLQSIKNEFGSLKDKSVILFTGPGNNGGDGFCLARALFDLGARPVVFAYRMPEALKGAARKHAELARAALVPIMDLGADSGGLFRRITRETASHPFLIVDALLGTGLSRELSPELRQLIEAINELTKFANIPVVSIDAPSGLSSDTGRPMPVAIQAHLTVTIEAAKPGLVLPEAVKYCGKLVCCSIGLPLIIRHMHPTRWRLLDGRALADLPALPPASYKNRFGHVAIIGGAEGYSGAAHLAAAAALRSGAGLVTACAPPANTALVKSDWPEIMILPAGEGQGWGDGSLPDISFATSIVIGPGLSRTPAAARLLEATLKKQQRPPCVIDADALSLLAENGTLFEYLDSDDVITPHPGEAARLLHCSARDIQADRTNALDALCAKTGAIVILKGASTIMGRSSDTRLLCPYDIPQLAIAGAGDVLAGCIGALIGSSRWALLPDGGRFTRLGQAATGVALHAIAGLNLARHYRERGFTASQLADALPKTWEISQPDNPEILPWPEQG